jgi:hypothetical protein
MAQPTGRVVWETGIYTRSAAFLEGFVKYFLKKGGKK